MDFSKAAVAILFLLAILTILHIIQFSWAWRISGDDGLKLNFGGGIGLLNDFPPSSSPRNAVFYPGYASNAWMTPIPPIAPVRPLSKNAMW